MARIKKQPVDIEFTADYAGKEAGYVGSFMPELASAIVRSGNAKYKTDVEQPKETKLKTSKKKKDEKNNDDTAV